MQVSLIFFFVFFVCTRIQRRGGLALTRAAVSPDQLADQFKHCRMALELAAPPDVDAPMKERTLAVCILTKYTKTSSYSSSLEIPRVFASDDALGVYRR
jgi:hypothetical protein